MSAVRSALPALHLLDYRGAVRPGRASIEVVADVLEGRESDRLATVTLDDGALVVMPLDAAAIEKLRADLTQVRCDALLVALDCALALVRASEGLPGVSVCSYYSEAMTVDLVAAPWAEDVVLAWAHEKALTLDGNAPPSQGGEWSRRCRLRLSAEAYASTVVLIQWPTVTLSVDEIVARDAEEEGRDIDAAVVRANERQTIPVVSSEEPLF